MERSSKVGARKYAYSSQWCHLSVTLNMPPNCLCLPWGTMRGSNEIRVPEGFRALGRQKALALSLPRSAQERFDLPLINAPNNACGDLSTLIPPLSEDLSSVREL